MPTTNSRFNCLLYVKNVVRYLANDLQIDQVTIDYVIKRLHNEGIGFVTKALPAFSAYTLQCVERMGIIDPRTVGMTYFRIRKGAPDFMSGYLFKAIEGCPSSLYTIRQFCEYFYKTAFAFTGEQLTLSEANYVSIEDELKAVELDADLVEDCRKTAERCFPELTRFDLSTAFSNSRPRYGPGTFLGANSKRCKRENKIIPYEHWKKLPLSDENSVHESMKPYLGFFKPYPGARRVKPRTHTRNSKKCKIQFVPKDARGPRVISTEQPDLILGQMSFNSFISGYLEAKSHQKILFSDQELHRSLALQGSIDRSISTVDLKDASDRVSLKLIRRITRNFPIFRLAAEHLRATHCILPSSKEIELKKWANMGSGLCFPTLALIVWVVAVTVIAKQIGLNKAKRCVYVYGDDLIIPNRFYESVCAGLVAVGLRVNQHKSYHRGYFRESCGGDYYHGKSVGPVRLRLSNADLGEPGRYRNLCLQLQRDGGILQLERHCRELIDNGLFKLSSYYYRRLEKTLGKLPYVHSNSHVLGRVDNYLAQFEPEQKALVPTTKKYTDNKNEPCPYKGIGRSLISSEGLGEDWSLTPLRRSVQLRKRLVSQSQIQSYGRTDNWPA